jgi:hypothetical protein
MARNSAGGQETSGCKTRQPGWAADKLAIGAGKMNRILLTLTTILVLAMLIVPSALAATIWTLNIHNDTENQIKLTLIGPKTYVFTLQPGKYAKEVQEGDYKFSYTACGGQKFSGTVSIKDSLQWIVIDLCSEAPQYAKFVVDSHLGETLTLTLTGPQTYALTIDLGRNRFLALQTGDYTYSYDACGTSPAGEIRILKNGEARLILYSCQQDGVTSTGYFTIGEEGPSIIRSFTIQ